MSLISLYVFLPVTFYMSICPSEHPNNPKIQPSPVRCGGNSELMIRTHQKQLKKSLSPSLVNAADKSFNCAVINKLSNEKILASPPPYTPPLPNDVFFFFTPFQIQIVTFLSCVHSYIVSGSLTSLSPSWFRRPSVNRSVGWSVGRLVCWSLLYFTLHTLPFSYRSTFLYICLWLNN